MTTYSVMICLTNDSTGIPITADDEVRMMCCLVLMINERIDKDRQGLYNEKCYYFNMDWWASSPLENNELVRVLSGGALQSDITVIVVNPGDNPPSRVWTRRTRYWDLRPDTVDEMLPFFTALTIQGRVDPTSVNTMSGSWLHYTDGTASKMDEEEEEE